MRTRLPIADQGMCVCSRSGDSDTSSCLLQRSKQEAYQRERIASGWQELLRRVPVRESWEGCLPAAGVQPVRYALADDRKPVFFQLISLQ